MMIKSTNKLRFLIRLILLIGSISLTACKDEFDELSGGAENLIFTQLMEATPYASADYLIMSENSQYIIITHRDESTSYAHYYSIDEGRSFDLLTDKYSTLTGKSIIDSYISNDGKFIYYDSNYGSIVYDLNTAADLTNTPYGYQAFAVTATGKLLSYQYDENIGQNTYFIFENGAYVSSGIPNVIDPEIGYAGTSGSKVGFFANNTLAEFDVNTKQYTERPAPGGNYANIYKSRGIQATYSQGYFAHASQYGVVIISPDDQVISNPYPTEYQFYLQTRGRVFMNKDKVYVQVSAYYGELETYVTSGVNEAEMVISNNKFPIAAHNETIVSQGFIEGGKRLEGGLIVDKNGTKTYLDFSIRSSVPRTAFKVGSYLYMNDKRFDIDSKTFYLTGMGDISNIFYDDNQTIAYTTTGTYISTDDRNWNLKVEDQPKPSLITKDNQGTYHALDIQPYTYYLGGTGFGVPKFNQAAFTSSDGISWQLIDEKAGLDGNGPSALLPDGSSGFTFNTNPLGNQSLYTNFTFDYGITYEGFPKGTEPNSYKLFDHQTVNGRYVNAYFESLDGLLYIEICDSDKTTCKEITATPTFDSSQSYASGNISYTDNDEILIIDKEGIYLTSKL